MTIADQIYTIVQTLPQDRAREVLAFAEFVRSKPSLVHSSTTAVDTSVPWIQLVHSLAGSWADNFPGLEDIRAEEGQDIARESL